MEMVTPKGIVNPNNFVIQTDNVLLSAQRVQPEAFPVTELEEHKETVILVRSVTQMELVLINARNKHLLAVQVMGPDKHKVIVLKVNFATQTDYALNFALPQPLGA